MILNIVRHLEQGLLAVYNHFRVKLLLRLAFVCSAPASHVSDLYLQLLIQGACVIEHFWYFILF